MIETVRIQGEGYLVNGSMVVPKAEGNRHYQEVQEWIAQGNTPEPEFTQAELDQRAIDEANQVEFDLLAELDRASIRDIREWIAAQPDAPQMLKDREAQAVVARGRLQ